MTIITEGAHAGEYIASEASGTRAREVITLTDTNGTAGMVLGKLTTGGKYVQFDPAASDGSEDAAAVLFDNIDARTSDKAAVVTARDTEVKANRLTWPAGITAPQKAAAIADLAALGIIVR